MEEKKLKTIDSLLESVLELRLEYIFPFYFVVSLFRLLQQGEFYLTPRDAYWLGIVDEVIGDTDLPCPRLLLESQLSTSPKEGDNQT